jgi:hypothetical protein
MFTHQNSLKLPHHFLVMDNKVQPMEDVKEPAKGSAHSSKPSRHLDEKDDIDEQPTAKRAKIRPSYFYVDNAVALGVLQDDCKLLRDLAAIVVDYDPITEVKDEWMNCDVKDHDHHEFDQLRELRAKFPNEIPLTGTIASYAGVFSRQLAGRDSTINFTLSLCKDINSKWFFGMDIKICWGRVNSLRRYFTFCPICLARMEDSSPWIHHCGCPNHATLYPVCGTESSQYQGRFFRVPLREQVLDKLKERYGTIDNRVTIVCNYDRQ